MKAETFIQAPAAGRATTRATRYDLLAVFIAVAGIGFRLLFIADSDLWLDEIWTVNADAAHRSFGDVLRAALADQHPPLYDLLLHGWLRAVPDAPLAGRWLSLVFGAAGLWMTHAYSARISGRKAAGLFAMLLVAASSFHAMHSIEMRYYALVYALALGALGHLVLFLRKEGGAIRHLLLFGALALALLYTHIYGAFFLAALGLAVILLALFRKLSRKQLLQFLVVASILALLYAPFFLHLLAAPKFSGVGWMQLASPAVFLEYLYNYSNKNPVEAAAIGLPLMLCFLLYRKAPVVMVVLVFSIIGTFLLGYLFSILRQPMLHERYTMVYFPSFVLLAAVFWADVFRRGKFGLLLLGCAVAVSAVINLGFINPFREHLRHEPWRAMADTLHALPEDRRAPVYADEPQYINYYLRYAGEPDAQPVSTRAADERFWYVQTGYHHPSVPGSDTLVEVERREFPERFALVLFGRKD